MHNARPVGATLLDTSTGDSLVALFVQAENWQLERPRTRRQGHHWNSDVVINSGPSPLLIIAPDGTVGHRREHHGQRGAEPKRAPIATGGLWRARPYVEVNDHRRTRTPVISDAVAAAARSTAARTSADHYWGTFSFRDNWKTVTIINHSTRDLIIDNIDVINRTANAVGATERRRSS